MPRGKKSPVKRKTRKTSPRRRVSPRRVKRKTSPRGKKRMNGVLDRILGSSSRQTGASPRLTQSQMDRITKLEEEERREKLRSIRGKRLGIELQRGVDLRALRTLSRDISRSRQTARESMGLQGMDFSGQDLTGEVFTEEDLTGANFRDTNLTDVNFEGAILDKCKMNRYTILDGTNFRNASLIEMESSVFPETKAADFSKSFCDGANFSKAILPRTNFGYAGGYNRASRLVRCQTPLPIQKPSGKGFTNMNFEDANLTNAKFVNINLSGSNFDRTRYVGGADFGGSNLENTSFRDLDYEDRSGSDDYNGLLFYHTFLKGARLDAYCDTYYGRKVVTYKLLCAKAIKKAIFRNDKEKKIILSIHADESSPGQSLQVKKQKENYRKYLSETRKRFKNF